MIYVVLKNKSTLDSLGKHAWPSLEVGGSKPSPNADNKTTNMVISCLHDWDFLCVIKEIKCFCCASYGTFVSNLGNNSWFTKNHSAPTYLSNVCLTQTSTVFQLRFPIKLLFEK